MGKTVLILGGSMAGLGVAHRLLKYTLPNEKDLKVIMVSKVRRCYCNPFPSACPNKHPARMRTRTRLCCAARFTI